MKFKEFKEQYETYYKKYEEEKWQLKKKWIDIFQQMVNALVEEEEAIKGKGLYLIREKALAKDMENCPSLARADIRQLERYADEEMTDLTKMFSE